MSKHVSWLQKFQKWWHKFLGTFKTVKRKPYRKSHLICIICGIDFEGRKGTLYCGPACRAIKQAKLAL